MTDVIISFIVYLSAFSMLIRILLNGRKKKEATPVKAEPAADQNNKEDLKGGEQA